MGPLFATRLSLFCGVRLVVIVLWSGKYSLLTSVSDRMEFECNLAESIWWFRALNNQCYRGILSNGVFLSPVEFEVKSFNRSLAVIFNTVCFVGHWSVDWPKLQFFCVDLDYCVVVDHLWSLTCSDHSSLSVFPYYFFSSRRLGVLRNGDLHCHFDSLVQDYFQSSCVQKIDSRRSLCGQCSS